MKNYTWYYTVEEVITNNNNNNNKCKRICSVNLMRAWVQLHNFVIYVVCLISSYTLFVFKTEKKCTLLCVCMSCTQCTYIDYTIWVEKNESIQWNNIHIYVQQFVCLRLWFICIFATVDGIINKWWHIIITN